MLSNSCSKLQLLLGSCKMQNAKWQNANWQNATCLVTSVARYVVQHQALGVQAGRAYMGCLLQKPISQLQVMSLASVLVGCKTVTKVRLLS